MHSKKKLTVTSGWFLVSLIAVLGSFQPVFALTREEIDLAIHRGHTAESLEDVPEFLVAGKKSPKGAFYRVVVRMYEPPYFFIIQTCHQWIANMTFRAKLNGDELNITLIEEQCLGQDVVRAGAAPMDAELHREKVEQAQRNAPEYGFWARAPAPVTDVFLELDGEITKPLGGRSTTDEGGYTAQFDAAVVRASKSAIIIVTVDSTYQLKVKISKVVLRHLFSGEPLPKKKTRATRATDDDW